MSVMLPLASAFTAAPLGYVGYQFFHYMRAPHNLWTDRFPLPDNLSIDTGWTSTPESVALGVTNRLTGTQEHGYHTAVWGRDPHLLLSGSTGAGKTGAMRFLTYSLLRAGYQLAMFDGKGAGSFAAALDGRASILGVAHSREEWIDLALEIKALVNTWYASNLAYESGHRADKPEPLNIALIVDELVDIAHIAGDKFVEPLGEIARMGREAGVRIAASVLRPDAAAEIPTLVKEQFRARVVLGVPTPQAGYMMFEGDWSEVKALVDNRDRKIPGRCLALLDGRAFRVQVPWVPPATENSSWLPEIAEPTFTTMATSARMRARQLHEQGESYHAITRTLSAEGYTTKRGTPWTDAAVRRLIHGT